jgi:hypothetical protein
MSLDLVTQCHECGLLQRNPPIPSGGGVRWVLLDPYPEDALLVKENSYQVTAASGEPASLVEAMSRVLGDFSRDVANAIRGLPRPRHFDAPRLCGSFVLIRSSWSRPRWQRF